MSWQSNELFVMGIEYDGDGFNGRMLDALDATMYVYEVHGNRWYMFGDMYTDDTEDDYDGFRLLSGESYGSGWLPNPFMAPSVGVCKVRNLHDLIEVAFECADSHCGMVAYAGDYHYEPLEHVDVRGEIYDMRPGKKTCS